MINAMATIKSNIRGGIYSSLGEKIEKPLMLTLSKMLKVPEEYYTEPDEYEDKRQADFHYFKTNNENEIEKINCEVKYIGDIILDPFVGSSTVGKVCQKYNRFFFLTENNERYFKYSKSLLSESDLLSDNPPKFYDYNQFLKLIENVK